MEKESQVNILESVEFLFRHPWIFFSSIIIIMSIVFAQLSFIKFSYKASAVVSFEMVTREGYLKGKKIDRMVHRILFGESILDIIKKGWPNVDEKKNPQEYVSIRRWLRSRGGIKLNHDEQTGFVAISFQSGSPTICYNVIQAVIDVLKKENKKASMKKLASSQDFLKEELKYYKLKLKRIDEEISGIIIDLREVSGELSDQEKTLIAQITGKFDFDIAEKTALQKFAKYDGKLVDLSLQVLEAEKRKAMFEEALESGEITIKESGRIDIERDDYVKQYSRLMAAKLIEITNLQTQGFLSAHPKVTRLEREIASLRMLKENRINELRGESELRLPEEVESVRIENERRITENIKEIVFSIEILKDKINMIEGQYKKDSGVTSEDVVFKADEVSAKAIRLKELRDEKKISQNYYNKLKRSLADAELKSRVEESEAGLAIVVIEEPEIPKSPIPFQKTQRIAFGFTISIFMGALLAYIFDSLDNSVKTASELRSLLKKPILGSTDQINTISEIRTRSLRHKAIIAGWIIFMFASKFIVKVFF